MTVIRDFRLFLTDKSFIIESENKLWLNFETYLTKILKSIEIHLNIYFVQLCSIILGN